jgi:raffinose/stachyose/melibiose transport system permease protein
MPNLIGGIVLGYIWNLLINSILGIFGYDITYDADYGFWGLVFLLNWQLIGYMMVIYIAGLQNIPKELNEAALIDGASSFSILRNIKIPMVMPSVTICLFLTLTNSFKGASYYVKMTNARAGRQVYCVITDKYGNSVKTNVATLNKK